MSFSAVPRHVDPRRPGCGKERVPMTLVLIVDDEAASRQRLFAMLRSEAFDVLEAATPESALRMAEQQLPDVVVHHAAEPPEQTLRLLTSLQQRWPALRIIAVLDAERADASTLMDDIGVEQSLLHPITRRELADSVRRAAEKKWLLEENARLHKVNRQQREELARLVAVRTAQVRDTKQALQATQERLKGLAANVPGVLLQFSYDPKDGLSLHYVSERSAQLLGLNPERLLEDSSLLFDLFHPEDRVSFFEQLTHVNMAEEAILTWEGRCRLSGGELHRCFELSARRQSTNHGLWAATLVDITERRDLQAKVMQADRLATLGTLAAGVAHEINNPLTYTLNNLQLLLAHERDANQKELLSEALDGATRVRDIVRSLKTFSRPSHEQFVSVDLHAVLQSSLRIARNSIQHGATIVEEFLPAPAVRANPQQLGQVFLNLLLNAAQAFGDAQNGGNVISVRAFTDADGYAVIEVSDNGPGIPRSLHHRVFEPFFTTKAHAEGTGLGLYICRDIIAAHDGLIAVRSNEPTGTTFSIRLPPTSEPANAPASLRATVTRHTGLTILIVDDEPLICRSLKRLLQGNTVMVADRGVDALRLLERQFFDVVFCDLMMPEIDGIDLHAAVSSKDPDQAQRFVFMTGGAFTERAQRFLASVDNRTLEKPVDAESIARALSRVQRRALPPSEV